jgi:rare lipoprotein A
MRWILAALMLCVNLPTARAEIASWYGLESGPRTASGERFNPNAMTAASRTLPFGTLVRVTYRGRSIVVRINDRGPAKWTHREIDLAHGAARAIGCAGVCLVDLEVIGR